MSGVLAFDPSLTGFGWRGDEDGGVIKPHTKLRGAERLAYIRNAVLVLLRQLQPEHVFMEELPKGGRQGSAGVIGRAELYGIVRLLCYDLEIPLTEVNPMTLKIFATGTGKASKDEMIANAIRRFAYLGNNNDEADALLLWHFGRSLLDGKPTIPLPATHLRALDGRVVLA